MTYSEAPRLVGTADEKKKFCSYSFLCHAVRYYLARQIGELDLHGDAQKFGLITARPDQEGCYVGHELRFAYILSELVSSEEIYDWYPTSPCSALDHAKVDFLILPKPHLAVPFQVCSTSFIANQKIRAINNLYPLINDKFPVAVVRLLLPDNSPLPPRNLQAWILQKIKDTAPISINPVASSPSYSK